MHWRHSCGVSVGLRVHHRSIALCGLCSFNQSPFAIILHARGSIRDELLDIDHYELLSYVRSDARHDKPQYDTFGGRMDLRDDKQYNRCGLRELREEAKLPRQWHELVGTELSAFPDGRDLVELVRPTTQWIYRQAIWVVPIPAELASSPVFLTANGALEAVPRSLRWRPARSVFSNLETFATFHPLSSALEQILETVHTETSLVDPSTSIMTL